MAEAEPVIYESEEVVQVAEAAPAPEPTPAPVVNEAPAQAPAPAPAETEPKMPATGSSLPLLALTGLALVGGGALLLRQRAV